MWTLEAVGFFYGRERQEIEFIYNLMGYSALRIVEYPPF